MRLKCLFVLLMVGLMASVGFAAVPANVCWWDGTNSKWDDTDGQNWQDELGNAIAKPDGSKEIQAFGGTDTANPLGGTITLDSHEDWADIYSNRVRISGGVILNIVPNIIGEFDITSLIGPGWLRVGQMSAPGASVVNQSGGRLMLIGSVAQGGLDSTRLVLGDSQDAGGNTSGTYNMSGGTLTHANLPGYTDSEGLIVIGDRGGTGTFIVQGTAPVINMGGLYVGGNSGRAGDRASTGTLEFDVKAAGVSAVNVTDVVALDPYGASSTAALVVTVTEALVDPFAPIVLVRNTGTTQVSGRFDTFNGVNAVEGAVAWCYYDSVYRKLTYLYDADGDGINNDIALLIPEPAAIALLSIGLFAIRRKKK